MVSNHNLGVLTAADASDSNFPSAPLTPCCRRTTSMTSEQREVIDLLRKEWKIRRVRQDWLLKESGLISSYVNIPGGEPTLRQLRELGYIDERNRITELGRATE